MRYDGMIGVYTVPEKVVELSLPSMIDDWRQLATIEDETSAPHKGDENILCNL